MATILPEALARMFHESYERLAPQHGYQTRKESAVPWEAVPEQNRGLMTHVCSEFLYELGKLGIIPDGGTTNLDSITSSRVEDNE